jgi:hypothetical protein
MRHRARSLEELGNPHFLEFVEVASLEERTTKSEFQTRTRFRLATEKMMHFEKHEKK